MTTHKQPLLTATTYLTSRGYMLMKCPVVRRKFPSSFIYQSQYLKKCGQRILMLFRNATSTYATGGFYYFWNCFRKMPILVAMLFKAPECWERGTESHPSHGCVLFSVSLSVLFFEMDWCC